jgi:hypothetical protein
MKRTAIEVYVCERGQICIQFSLQWIKAKGMHLDWMLIEKRTRKMKEFVDYDHSSVCLKYYTKQTEYLDTASLKWRLHFFQQPEALCNTITYKLLLYWWCSRNGVLCLFIVLRLLLNKFEPAWALDAHGATLPIQWQMAFHGQIALDVSGHKFAGSLLPLVQYFPRCQHLKAKVT